MNIDASLQSFMDPYINIARATVAKGASDKELVNTVLLTFGGLGLAKAVTGKKGTKWIPTDQLNEFTDPAELPADLTPVMLAFKDRSGEREMAKSLRLIISDMIAIGRQKQPKLAENITADTTLLTLAGDGAVSLVKGASGDPIWVADPDIIDQFQTIRNGLVGHAVRRQSKIQMDDVLKTITDQFSAMAKKRFGESLSKRTKRAGIIRMLLTQEINGNAIVYKDSKGRLAWKASADLCSSFE
jgi:hypothetical protein